MGPNQLGSHINRKATHSEDCFANGSLSRTLRKRVYQVIDFCVKLNRRQRVFAVEVIVRYTTFSMVILNILVPILNRIRRSYNHAISYNIGSSCTSFYNIPTALQRISSGKCNDFYVGNLALLEIIISDYDWKDKFRNAPL